MSVTRAGDVPTGALFAAPPSVSSFLVATGAVVARAPYADAAGATSVFAGREFSIFLFIHGIFRVRWSRRIFRAFMRRLGLGLVATMCQACRHEDAAVAVVRE